jgi:iron transport multicopper oxidase
MCSQTCILTLSHFWLLQGHYVDGLRAPLVLHPPKEAYSYDEEFTVILGDWYHQEHQVLLAEFINIANPGGAEPVPGRLIAHL